MGLFKSRGSDRTPVRVEPTAPLGGAVVETPESVSLEDRARRSEAKRLIHRTLLAESLRPPAFRDQAVLDLCLDLRSILMPSAPDPQDLREMPPVPLRYAVPVNPGRPS